MWRDRGSKIEEDSGKIKEDRGKIEEDREITFSIMSHSRGYNFFTLGFSSFGADGLCEWTSPLGAELPHIP